MNTVAQGTEQNTLDLAASAQLAIDGVATTFTLTTDTLVKVVVQLGNADNLLHTDGGILAITVKVTNAATGDKCVMPQKQMNLAAGDQLAFIALDPFWVENNSIIEVHAKSSNGNDGSVGGKTWIADATPISLSDIGWTAGGTMTIKTLYKLLAAWIAGTWQDKSGSSTIKELLDADDGSVVVEQTLSSDTPYRESTIL